MRFRNSFTLCTNNFKHVYMLLLFTVVIGVIVGALTAVILSFGIRVLVGSDEMAVLLDSLEELFATFLSSASFADFDENFRYALDVVADSFGGIWSFMGKHAGEIALSVLALVALYLVSRYLNGLANFAYATIINDRMSTFSDTPFFTAFLSNIGKAALYEVVYVPLAFVFDALSVIVAYLFFFVLCSFMHVLLEIFFAATFIIAMQALKLAIVTDWMPAMVADGKKLRTAIRETFSGGRRQFGVSFSNYLIAVYCILAVNVVFALTSFLSALIITVPFSYAFLLCMQFVNYYTARGRRYFLSYTHIVESADDIDRCTFMTAESLAEGQGESPAENGAGDPAGAPAESAKEAEEDVPAEGDSVPGQEGKNGGSAV